MNVRLTTCPACDELVLVGVCECPHCGKGGVCRAASLPASALLLGLSLAGCTVVAQPAYGVAFTDEDADGWAVQEGDCDDGDDTIHPEAEETPGDGIDSNCDGEDDT